MTERTKSMKKMKKPDQQSKLRKTGTNIYKKAGRDRREPSPWLLNN